MKILLVLAALSANAHQPSTNRPQALEKEPWERCHVVRNTVASWLLSLTGTHKPAIVHGPFDGPAAEARKTCETKRQDGTVSKNAWCSCATFQSLGLEEGDKRLIAPRDAAKASK